MYITYITLVLHLLHALQSNLICITHYKCNVWAGNLLNLHEDYRGRPSTWYVLSSLGAESRWDDRGGNSKSVRNTELMMECNDCLFEGWNEQTATPHLEVWPDKSEVETHIIRAGHINDNARRLSCGLESQQGPIGNLPAHEEARTASRPQAASPRLAVDAAAPRCRKSFTACASPPGCCSPPPLARWIPVTRRRIGLCACIPFTNTRCCLLPVQVATVGRRDFKFMIPDASRCPTEERPGLHL